MRVTLMENFRKPHSYLCDQIFQLYNTIGNHKTNIESIQNSPKSTHIEFSKLNPHMRKKHGTHPLHIYLTLNLKTFIQGKRLSFHSKHGCFLTDGLWEQ